MHILILKGQSQYEGTRTFADLAAGAMRRAGHEATVVDLVGVADLRAAVTGLADTIAPDLVFTINILGEFRSADGRTMTEVSGAPHVVWYTDYVFSLADRLRMTPAGTAVLMVDPTQVDGVRRLFGSTRHPNLGFFPHPAATEQSHDGASAEAYAARPIPVLWSGTCQRPVLPWASAPPATRKLLDEALEQALASEWMPPQEILDEVLARHGFDLAHPANIDVRLNCCHLDATVRTTRRFAFIKALAKTGLPVVICGEGWKEHLYRFKNVQYLGPQPMPKVVELMRQSRIVLNTNGNFGGGSHERPFTALLSGALPFTDTSRYYEQIFEDGRDIAMFRWMDLPAGFARLRHLLDHPEEAFAMAQRGKAKAAADHTWDARLPLIFKAAGLQA